MKRLFDIVMASLFLILLSPIFAVAALAIKLTSQGPIFFTQQRIGQNRRIIDRRKKSKNDDRFGDRRQRDLFGKPINIYKFRTMNNNASSRSLSLTTSNDGRVTKLGKFLRKWKIDELPQLWNVLKGDMSLVGPRPEVHEFVKYYSPEQRNVLKVRPGITDLASIIYRNESELLAACDNVNEFYLKKIMPDKLQMNLDYIERHSLLFDTKLIFRTLKAVIFN